MEKTFLFETTGFSMWPFLKAGSKLFVKKAPIEKLKAGDIILYRKNNQVVCHRLIKKDARNGKCFFYARGDNALSLSEPLPESAYVGKGVAILKKGKIVSLCSFRRRFLNRIIIVIAPYISCMIRVAKPCYDRLGT